MCLHPECLACNSESYLEGKIQLSNTKNPAIKNSLYDSGNSFVIFLMSPKTI